MKKRFLCAVIIIVLFFIGYYIVINNTNAHLKINVSDVQSLQINNKIFESVTSNKDIEKFVQIYNKAKVCNKSNDTTPAYIIVIELVNGEEINIEGTTQGFHYVSNDEKSYKISSADLTYYLKAIMK